MKIAGILLAAGAGTRFGGGKLLADVRPNPALSPLPLCVAALNNLRASVDAVIAVVREGDTAVAQTLQAAGATTIVCTDAHEGMGRSLACGVRATADADAWIVALGDMPLIAPASIEAVAKALRAGSLIAAPSYAGQRGHPVGFGAALREDLLACVGDAGARALIQAHRTQVHLIAVDDAGVLADFDTREQLASLRPQP